MTVRVVARRDVITADMIRLQQVAEQVGYHRLISCLPSKFLSHKTIHGFSFCILKNICKVHHPNRLAKSDLNQF